MARFVLVHGSWHGGWCFDRLAGELRAGGHDVAAPDLPCDDPALDQRDYARLLGSHPDAVVVGHSLGGQAIGHVEARVRVYLSARLPVEGAFGECTAAGFGGFLRDALDRTYWPDPVTAATRLYSDCTRTDADWAFPQLRPQALFDEAVAPFGRGDVVLVARRDVVIDAAWQLRTASAYGARVEELDTGHFSMLTHPRELADLLVSVSG
jgi:pimeloyl-ACP methyl ester carboxylesterase